MTSTESPVLDFAVAQEVSPSTRRRPHLENITAEFSLESSRYRLRFKRHILTRRRALEHIT